MEKKIWLVSEKLKMLEVLIFDKTERKSEREEDREKEWMELKEDVTCLKRKDYEKSCEIEELKKKLKDMECADRVEKDELWVELEGWNTEWEGRKLKEREEIEQRKVERFNRKREEELWGGEIKNMEEELDLLRRRVRINEVEVDRFIKEASKAMIEVKIELELLKKEREDEGEASNDENKVKVETNKEGKKESPLDSEENREMKGIEGMSKLAVEWKDEEKKGEKEGEKE